MNITIIKIIFIILSICYSAFADAGSSRTVYWGDSTAEIVTRTTEHSSQKPLISIQGQLKSEALGSFAPNIPATSMYTGDGYIGIHFVPIISFHLKRRYILLSDFHKETAGQIRYLTEAWFIMLGNPVITRGHILLGRIPIPFGMAFHDSPDVIDVRVKQHRFDEKYGLGMQATYLDLVGAQVDIGLFSKEYDNYLNTADQTSKGATYSLRLIKDIPALDGVRVILSVMREIGGESRISTALYNKSTKGSTTELEWARRDPNMSNLLKDNDQLVRVFYGHELTQRSEITFQYEDDFINYWITSLGYRYGEFNNSKLGFYESISYYRSRQTSHDSGWLGAVGGRVKI